LSRQDYGILAMFYILLGISYPLVGLNVHGAISRRYFEQEKYVFSIYLTNCLFILMTSTVFFSTLYYFLSPIISKVTSLPANYVFVIPIVCCFQVLANIILVIWQAQVKPFKYSIFLLLSSLTNALVSIIFIVFLSYDWKGRVLAHIISVLIFSCLSSIVLWKNKLIQLKINFRYIANALKFGAPLLPHSMSSLIISMTDRIFITNLIGIAETGLYMVGYQIGQLINILGVSFQNAYIPWLYNTLNKNHVEYNYKIVKLAYIQFITFILLALILSFIAPKLMNVFIGEEFRGSHIYVIYIALGFAFLSMQKVVGPFIFYVGKTYLLGYVTFVVAIVNIIFNYIFITKNGSIGAKKICCYVLKLLTYLIRSAKDLRIIHN
jgi:O-antigen/teichoic acid export membrane protein